MEASASAQGNTTIGQTAIQVQRAVVTGIKYYSGNIQFIFVAKYPELWKWGASLPEALTCDYMHTEYLGEAVKHFTLFMRKYNLLVADGWRLFSTKVNDLMKENKKDFSTKFQSEALF